MDTAVIDRIIKAAEFLNEVADQTDKLVENVEGTADVTTSCEVFLRLKEAYEGLDKARKRIYAAKDKMDKAVVPAKLENCGMDKVQIPSLGRSFYTVTKYSASFVDREKGYEWLRENGNADVITETVNASTLAGLVKDMVLEEGIDPPEDVVKFTSYNTTGSSKYTPKKKA